MPDVVLSAAEFEALQGELADLRAVVVELTRVTDHQAERIKELEARLAKNSRNSSTPPSRDGLNKPPPKSRREKGQRKPGGQSGHKGHHQPFSDTVDEHQAHAPEGQCNCGRAWSDAEQKVLSERRQVFDVIIKRHVTEHRIIESTCACGCVRRGEFPDDVQGPVSYGPTALGAAVYLNQYQLLPVRRTAECLTALGGIEMSASTVAHAVTRAAAALEAPVQAIRNAITQASVAHADETGIRVAAGLHWLHVMSTPTLTAYFAHPKRGGEALDAFGMLADFHGILVHDHWKAYLQYAIEHAFCNAHHLRELTAVAESGTHQFWAIELIVLLCKAHRLTLEAQANGQPRLPDAQITAIQRDYDQLLSVGAAFNPENKPPPGTKRRVKQTPAFNLIKRLRAHRDETLRFLSDPRVPFDNNLAERDLRMPKQRQAISGCFRSQAGSQHFATVRSYFSTLRKQSADLFQAIVETFRGQPPLPQLE